MNLCSLPTDILIRIIYSLRGTNILYLSQTNKYFYNFLQEFRLLGCCLHNHWLSFPHLLLSDNTIRQNIRQSVIQQLNSIDWIFKFTFVRVILPDFSKQPFKIPPPDSVLLEINQHSTAADLDSLSCIPFVDQLRIVQNQPACSKVLEMVDLKQISSLYIYSCEVGDSTVSQVLSGISKTCLTELTLIGNNLTDNAAKEIAIYIPGSSLIKLELNYNDVTVVGLQELATNLQFSKIQHFSIDANEIEMEEYHVLYENLAYTQIQELYCTIDTEIIASALSGAISKSNLIKMDVDILPAFMDDILNAVCFSKVESLSLGGDDMLFDDESCSILSKYIDKLPIRTLNFDNCAISKSASLLLFSNIGQESKLTEIHIDGKSVGQIDGQIGNHFVHTNLEYITLRNCTLDDEFLFDIQKGIKDARMRFLDFTRNTFTILGVQNFADSVKYSSLDTINVQGSLIDGKTADIKTDNRSLNIYG
ncbi:hypothetical protein HDV01_003201 [Terramyces sp. JEL0728]|nr:hypothetical protein HDV01_003201 [Terramyces sp. JEL0728]